MGDMGRRPLLLVVGKQRRLGFRHGLSFGHISPERLRLNDIGAVDQDAIAVLKRRAGRSGPFPGAVDRSAWPRCRGFPLAGFTAAPFVLPTPLRVTGRPVD